MFRPPAEDSPLILDLHFDGAHQMDVLLLPGVDGLAGEGQFQKLAEGDPQGLGRLLPQLVRPVPNLQAEIADLQHATAPPIR